jgi:hypothetical protein
MKESDLALVRGGKLPKEALRWLTEVEKYFPGTTKDIVIVRALTPFFKRTAAPWGSS